MPGNISTLRSMTRHASAAARKEHHSERRPRDRNVFESEFGLAELNGHPRGPLAQRIHLGAHRHLVCIEQTVH